MPIVYAPPQPVSPEISSAYGRAAQSAADLPQIVAAQQRSRAIMQQAAEAGQQHQLQQAALAQQGAQFRMGLQESAYDRASNRNLEAAQFQSRLDQAPQLAQQHAELAAWVSGQEMTQADNMRLQRLQSALSSVMGDDTLTPQEKSDYALHLRTGIDPLQQRAKQTQMTHMEEQNRILVDQHTRNTKLQDLHDRYNAMTAQERLQTITLDDGSKLHYMPDGKGGYQQAKSEKGEHDATKQEAAQYKAEADALKQWHTAYDKARQTVTGWSKEMGEKDASGVAKHRYPSLQDSETFQHHVNQEMLNQGFDLIPEEYARKRVGKASAAGSPTAPIAPTAAGNEPVAGGAAKVEPLPEQKPFEAGKPSTPQQRQALEQFEAIKTEIDTTKLPAEEKKRLKDNLDAAKHWLSVYGSPDKMPEQLQASLRAVLALAKAASTPTPLNSQRSQGFIK